MSPDKRVDMANQIGAFFKSQRGDTSAIAEHLRQFWDPRMRAAIIARAEAGSTGLDPFVRKAVDELSAATRKETQIAP